MSINKTFLFGLSALIFAMAVYIFDYKREIKNEQILQSRILDFNTDQINYFQIIKQGQKLALQKDDKGWSILEPVQDQADNEAVVQFLNELAEEKQLSVIKLNQSDDNSAEIAEFGLDQPSAVFEFKNNLGQTRKISVGSIKNFEGNSYIRKDSDALVALASPLWAAKADNASIYYREKRFYRGLLMDVVKMNIKSLSDNFLLEYQNGSWQINGHNFQLDQNKIRELLKKISESKILDYVFEGEPSETLLSQTQVKNCPVRVELSTIKETWAACLNSNSKANILYALTERPTYLVSLDISLWELLGNLSKDSLRDRVSAFNAPLNEVRKIYFKSSSDEMSLIRDEKSWTLDSASTSAQLAGQEIDQNHIDKVLKKISDLKISEFIDKDVRSQFTGQNILILKSDQDKLILQLNWGPEFKLQKSNAESNYYYARTQLTENIFAIEKSIMDDLKISEIIKKKSNSISSDSTSEQAKK